MTERSGNVLEVVPTATNGQTWIRQLEIDVGLVADAAWDMAGASRRLEGAITIYDPSPVKRSSQ